MPKSRVGKPNPKSYIDTTDCRDFGGKPSGEDGCYREKFLNFIALACAEPDPKTAFSRDFAFRLSCAQPIQ